MSRYQFELAKAADDADLRRVLARTPMPGPIAVTFQREPSYFDAAVVEGGFRQVVACRDGDSGHIVGFGARSVGERFVNGRPLPIGYLSSLRLLEGHRNIGLVARGYAYFRGLHGDGRTRLYVTTIAEGNERAIRLLTSGRAGLPAYHFAGRYHTIALPVRHGCARGKEVDQRGSFRVSRGLEEVQIRPARSDDLPDIVTFLQSIGPERQFFPCYQPSDFFRPGGPLRNLAPGDLLLAFRAGKLAGTLGGWDQSGFKQTVVAGYQGWLRWLRWLYNGWALWSGRPRLPPAGQALPYLTAALPVVADGDCTVFRALLDALLCRAGEGQNADRVRAGTGSESCSRNSPEYLLLGLDERDPLLGAVRHYPAVWYTTNVYLVCWEDGEELRAGLDGRPFYLELGGL